MKKCTKCGEVKPLDCFSINGKRKHSQCKKCKNEYSKKHKKINAKTISIKSREKSKKYRKELAKNYIKGMICKNTDLKFTDIPPELIEAKRLYIKIQRTLKELA